LLAIVAGGAGLINTTGNTAVNTTEKALELERSTGQP
jgi:hypothetical protein